MSDKFNGDKLRLIRLFHGLSQEELGALASSSRQFIQQLETGVRYPNAFFIEVLSEALEVYKEFFFTPLEHDVKEEQCHFRRQRTTTANTVRQAISHATLFDSLIAIFDAKLTLPRVNFPDVYPSDLVEIEDIAETCRKHWGFGSDAPIQNMMRIIENAGAVVSYFKNDSSKIDALSISRVRPIILLNYDKGVSSARIRFDLAHECGHLVMHQGLETGDHKTEMEANRFASAFLLPRRAFMQEFPHSSKRFNWSEIYKMKLRWKTSVSAIIRRAADLRIIDSMQYRRANIYLSKSGQTKHEEYDEYLEKEPPELLKIAVDACEKAFNISLEDVGTKLNLKPVSISKLAGMEVTLSTKGKISYFERHKFLTDIK